MNYVVVDAKTRCAVRHPETRKEVYATQAAAKAAATRMLARGALERLKDGTSRYPSEVEVMDTVTYAAQVPMREVTNLMTGKKVMERADTPWSCSVASESFWSG